MTNKIMYFIANWKMYGNLKSLNTLNKVIRFSKSKEIVKGRLIYCPPNTLISSFLKKFENCLIDIGGQNCHESEDYGSHTGFVNSKMLKSSGANYVILGHSENRQKGETDKLINLKIKSAIKSNLKVIFCIGETLAEKKRKKTKSILSKQIKQISEAGERLSSGKRINSAKDDAAGLAVATRMAMEIAGMYIPIRRLAVA